MELNYLVFPSPKLQWDINRFPGELLWIPVKPSSLSFADFNLQIESKVDKVVPMLTRETSQAVSPTP